MGEKTILYQIGIVCLMISATYLSFILYDVIGYWLKKKEKMNRILLLIILLMLMSCVEMKQKKIEITYQNGDKEIMNAPYNLYLNDKGCIPHVDRCGVRCFVVIK